MHDFCRSQGRMSLHKACQGKHSCPTISRDAESSFLFGTLASNLRAAFLEVCTIAPCSPCRASLLQAHMGYQFGVSTLINPSQVEFMTTGIVYIQPIGEKSRIALSATTARKPVLRYL
jgi:hypothetical protein